MIPFAVMSVLGVVLLLAGASDWVGGRLTALGVILLVVGLCGFMLVTVGREL